MRTAERFRCFRHMRRCYVGTQFVVLIERIAALIALKKASPSVKAKFEFRTSSLPDTCPCPAHELAWYAC